MAIIGKIRKHSGLAVIIIGVAIAAFVIGDFGKKSAKGTNNIGTVNGENLPYVEFNAKVDETMNIQKENSGTDKITDQEAYSIRQSTWTTMVKQILMDEEYNELGLTVSSEELFDQIQGKQPHRYILQYFKDPKTGQYDPAMVLNYLKNLDKMEPKNREQWLHFEKAIKDDRLETKFNNLVLKGYYVPTAFLKKDFINQTKSLKVRSISPSYNVIADSTIKLTDADYQKFYDKNRGYFFQDEAYRDLDYVAFEVLPSDADRKKTAEDVAQLYQDFLASSNVLNFTNANSDQKVDTMFVKKGKFPGMLDSLLFTQPAGSYYPPFELSNTWYMAKLLSTQERPDSMKGYHILIAWAGQGNESIKRTKEQAKVKADSLFEILKKTPDKFSEIAKITSDYPTAKEDGGDLKWFLDGNANYGPFFEAGLGMKPNDIKVVETLIGYAVFKMSEKTKPIKKVKAAVLARSIEPSNQTYQDYYMKASAFAGQYKTQEAFEKAAIERGLQKRSSPNIKEMDNYIMGIPAARDIVRWAYAENTKVGEVSPVFDVQGKYVVVLLKKASQKGLQPLESLKPQLEGSVKNMKKIEIFAENMKKDFATIKDINALAAKYNVKVDTTILTFTGFSRSAIGREMDIIGKLFTAKKGEVLGPLTGNYGAYFAIIDEINEPSQKEDFTVEKTQQLQNFQSRATGSIYPALEKTAKIEDNRLKFY